MIKARPDSHVEEDRATGRNSLGDTIVLSASPRAGTPETLQPRFTPTISEAPHPPEKLDRPLASKCLEKKMRWFLAILGDLPMSGSEVQFFLEKEPSDMHLQ